MPVLNVSIKHSGKLYPVSLDTDKPGLAFKEDVYQLTGVPIDRMKVMVKGGILKDDASWSKIAPKEGQTFTVIGAAGELPKPPEKAIVFLEDLGDEDLAHVTAPPAGLVNLGNTCYMNATLQSLRAIPELQVALNAASSSSAALGSGSLPSTLRELFETMEKTTDSISPTRFLNHLRQVNPQFAEQSRSSSKSWMSLMGGGFAQQDAEECYGTILNSLRDVAVPGTQDKKFVEQYMMANIRREMKMKTEGEDSQEPHTIHVEKIMKVECNIGADTHYMNKGIESALVTQLTKMSPSLGREAVYIQSSRLTRLPAYLTVHMVRFAWRPDVGVSGGKAKIMRNVKFPLTYDALEIVTPELKEKLLPVSRKLLEVEKERAERKKVRKRTKNLPQASSSVVAAPAREAEDETETAATAISSVELGPEENYRKKEVEQLVGLVDEGVKADIGSSWSGLYELVAIITHKGAAADSGHYMGFARKSAFTPKAFPGVGAGADGDVTMAEAAPEEEEAPGFKINPNLNPLPGDEDDEDWYKFDDDKVRPFPKEKVGNLSGGGEDSSAYVLLYRTKSF